MKHCRLYVDCSLRNMLKHTNYGRTGYLGGGGELPYNYNSFSGLNMIGSNICNVRAFVNYKNRIDKIASMECNI